ncbi:RNase A-like domain-containing protein [Ensifer sp. SL37]|uniref:RNase A-like domain-containing protein n=1 Tax=Ensifer sp. SL37 TaxID=2995137 RepID=UPI002276F7EE|nr:RNase A-like domain-containing protein [Ensifer sp. SL37]MCY1740899.1 hypothetical protein [Ensifer sp. SL37]
MTAEGPVRPDGKRPKPMAASQSPSDSALVVAGAVKASSPVQFVVDQLRAARIDPAGKTSIKTGIELKSHGYQAPGWDEQDSQVSNVQAAIQGQLKGVPPLDVPFREHLEAFYDDPHLRSKLNVAVPKLLTETAPQAQGLSEKGRSTVLGLASGDRNYIAVVPAINGYPAKNALFISERSNFTAEPLSTVGNNNVDAGGQPLGQTPGVLVLFDTEGKVNYRELNSQQDAFDLLSDPRAARQLLPHFSHAAQTARTSGNQYRRVPDVFEAFEKGRKGELDNFAFSIETPKQASDAGGYLQARGKPYDPNNGGEGKSYGPENLGGALADSNVYIGLEDGIPLLASKADLALGAASDLLKKVSVAAAIAAPVSAATPLLEEAEVAAETTAAAATRGAASAQEAAAAELKVAEDLASTQPQAVPAEEGLETGAITPKGFFNPPKRVPDGRLGYLASPDKPIKWPDEDVDPGLEPSSWASSDDGDWDAAEEGGDEVVDSARPSRFFGGSSSSESSRAGSPLPGSTIENNIESDDDFFAYDVDNGPDEADGAAGGFAPGIAKAKDFKLEQNERAGGHVIERHVGKSADYLTNRLSNEQGLLNASTFPDKATAEAAIRSMLDQSNILKSGKIQKLVSGRGVVAEHGDVMVVDATFDQDIGTVLVKDGKEMVATNKVHMYLKQEPDGKWVVETAYPVLEYPKIDLSGPGNKTIASVQVQEPIALSGYLEAGSA